MVEKAYPACGNILKEQRTYISNEKKSELEAQGTPNLCIETDPALGISEYYEVKPEHVSTNIVDIFTCEKDDPRPRFEAITYSYPSDSAIAKKTSITAYTIPNTKTTLQEAVNEGLTTKTGLQVTSCQEAPAKPAAKKSKGAKKPDLVFHVSQPIQDKIREGNDPTEVPLQLLPGDLSIRRDFKVADAKLSKNTNWITLTDLAQHEAEFLSQALDAKDEYQDFIQLASDSQAGDKANYLVNKALIRYHDSQALEALKKIYSSGRKKPYSPGTKIRAATIHTELEEQFNAIQELPAYTLPPLPIKLENVDLSIFLGIQVKDANGKVTKLNTQEDVIAWIRSLRPLPDFTTQTEAPFSEPSWPSYTIDYPISTSMTPQNYNPDDYIQSRQPVYYSTLQLALAICMLKNQPADGIYFWGAEPEAPLFIPDQAHSDNKVPMSGKWYKVGPLTHLAETLTALEQGSHKIEGPITDEGQAAILAGLSQMFNVMIMEDLKPNAVWWNLTVHGTSSAIPFIAIPAAVSAITGLAVLLYNRNGPGSGGRNNNGNNDGSNNTAGTGAAGATYAGMHVVSQQQQIVQETQEVSALTRFGSAAGLVGLAATAVGLIWATGGIAGGGGGMAGGGGLGAEVLSGASVVGSWVSRILPAAVSRPIMATTGAIVMAANPGEAKAEIAPSAQSSNASSILDNAKAKIKGMATEAWSGTRIVPVKVTTIQVETCNESVANDNPNCSSFADAVRLVDGVATAFGLEKGSTAQTIENFLFNK